MMLTSFRISRYLTKKYKKLDRTKIALKYISLFQKK